MANKLLNLEAETDAGVVDDDTVAIFTFENTSSGSAIKTVNSGTGIAFEARTNASSPVTVAPVRIGASAISGPALELQGTAFISALSGGSINGAIRVKIGDNYAWIPVMRTMGGLSV